MKKRGLLKAIIKAVFKGAVKSIPFGSVAVEVAETITNNTNASVLNGALTDDEIKKLQKISFYISVAVQVSLLISILYAFFTKQISIDDLIKYFNEYGTPQAPVN